MGNKRISLNIIFTVLQSTISVLCGLFSGRWLLSALGHEGFGVFSVVGSAIVFVLFLNNVLILSASRHFAYALGSAMKMSQKDGIAYLGEWFAASVRVHLVLPVILCGLGCIIGEWYVENKLIANAAMKSEALWVFRFSLAAAFLSIAAAPFFAMYTARQLIFVRTVFSLLTTVLNLAGVYCLFYISAHRVFWYGFIKMGIGLLFSILIVLVALLKFPECRRLFCATKWRYVKELFTYGGASLFGVFANMMRSQGIVVVVNHFSGLRVNAGLGVGNHIAGQTSVLSSATMTALLPEVTTCLSSGRKDRAISLIGKVNLFVPISLTLIIFPLLSNVDDILRLWLMDPPVYAAEFSAIGMFILYLDMISGGYQQLINANGVITAYQISVGTAVMMSVPIAYGCYSLGFSPVLSVGLGVLATTACLSPIRILFVKKLFGFSPWHWVRRGFIPNLILLVASYFVSFGLTGIVGSGLWQFFLVASINCLAVLSLMLCVISTEDRAFLVNKIRVVAKFHVVNGA